MPEPSGRSWAGVAILVGLAYAAVGIAFALPAAHAKAWRLAAWAVSAVAYAAHIGYERFGLQNRPATAALHVALAVALGSFGLAAGANIHALSVGSSARHQMLLRLSLAIWPVITALPALLVALVLNVVLARWKPAPGSRRL